MARFSSRVRMPDAGIDLVLQVRQSHVTSERAVAEIGRSDGAKSLVEIRTPEVVEATWDCCVLNDPADVAVAFQRVFWGGENMVDR